MKDDTDLLRDIASASNEIFPAQFRKRAYEECPKCGKMSRVATRGQPRKWLCPDCNADRGREHAAHWELLLATAGT